MTHNISAADFHAMRTFGRRAALYQDTSAVFGVAAFYVVAATPDEKVLLRMEFHEGVRNNAEDQKKTDWCMDQLENEVRRLEEEQ